MDFFMFVVVTNILIGWYNLARSNMQAKAGDYTRSNWSFGCGMLNIMMALGLIARVVYLEIICS